MNYETFINVDEIQILLNLLNESLKIKYPFYDFTLINATLKDNKIGLDVGCKKSDFNMCLAEFGEYRSEMPSYDDFLDGLFCSGILKYLNQWEIESLVDNVRKWPPNRKAVFLPDTNLFYHNFFSNFNQIQAHEILLVRTVLDEINHAQGKKYSDEMITGIRFKIRFQPELFDEFLNRRIKQSRCAQYNALNEVHRIQSKLLDTVDGVSTSTYDNDENDAIIVETAKKIFDEFYPDLYVITADKGLAERCKTVSVPHIFCKVPRAVEAVDCNYPAFRTLLSVLSYIFGVIKINSVVVYGEFQKRELTHEYSLKLVFQNKSLYEEFQKHLNLCREINKLGIPEGV